MTKIEDVLRNETQLRGYAYVAIKKLRGFLKKPETLRFLIETAIQCPWVQDREGEGAHVPTPYWSKDKRSCELRKLIEGGQLVDASFPGRGKGYRPGPQCPVVVGSVAPEPPWFQIDRKTAFKLCQKTPDVLHAMLAIYSTQNVGGDGARYALFGTEHLPGCSRSNVRTAITKLVKWGLATKISYAEYERKVGGIHAYPVRTLEQGVAVENHQGNRRPPTTLQLVSNEIKEPFVRTVPDRTSDKNLEVDHQEEGQGHRQNSPVGQPVLNTLKAAEGCGEVRAFSSSAASPRLDKAEVFEIYRREIEVYSLYMATHRFSLEQACGNANCDSPMWIRLFCHRAEGYPLEKWPLEIAHDEIRREPRIAYFMRDNYPEYLAGLVQEFTRRGIQ